MSLILIVYMLFLLSFTLNVSPSITVIIVTGIEERKKKVEERTILNNIVSIIMRMMYFFIVLFPFCYRLGWGVELYTDTYQYIS